MCKKCGEQSCGGCNGNSDIANALEQLAMQQDAIDTLQTSLKAFLNGHPILLIDTPDDVTQFDLGTGAGSGDWAGWGICNGSSYLNTITNKNIPTPNMTDRVPVQAGGSYALDEVFGEDNIVLLVGQLPVHHHSITDPGHTHVVNDPGHLHAVNDPGHTHGGTSSPHSHTLTINAGGAHNHSYASPDQAIGFTPGGTTSNGADLTLSGTTVDGTHTHTGVADPASVSVTVQNAFTGVQTLNAFTGITNDSATTGITVNDTGNDDPVDIRQKSIALFFAMKIQ